MRVELHVMNSLQQRRCRDPLGPYSLVLPELQAVLVPLGKLVYRLVDQKETVVYSKPNEVDEEEVVRLFLEFPLAQ